MAELVVRDKNIAMQNNESSPNNKMENQTNKKPEMDSNVGTDMKKSRNELLKDIQAADFAAYDLQLYLDTHPDDTDTLALYRTVSNRFKTLVKAYEKLYGPLMPMSDTGEKEWAWIKSPWPWD